LYGNTIFTTMIRTGATDHFGKVVTLNRWGGPLLASCVWGGDLGGSQIRFYNNIFIGKGSASDGLITQAGPGAFFNNLYWNTTSTFRVNGFNTARTSWTSYNSLDAWRTASGNEVLNGQNTGIWADPLLVSAGNGEKLTDPTKLPQVFAYMLKPNSPCIDKGLDLRTMGITPGNRDYYGRTIPYGSAFDIGACEYDGNPVEVAERFLNFQSGADLDGGAMRRVLTIRGMPANAPRSPTSPLFDCAGRSMTRSYPAPALMVLESLRR
jgi:hypothetical protein